MVDMAGDLSKALEPVGPAAVEAAWSPERARAIMDGLAPKSPAESTLAEVGSEEGEDSVLDALTPAFSAIALEKRTKLEIEDEGAAFREPLRDCASTASNVDRRQPICVKPTAVRPPATGALYQHKSSAQCVVLWVREGMLHDTGVTHQERKERLEVLVGADGALRGLKSVVVEEVSSSADLADIVRVHDCDYVEHVKRCCVEGCCLDNDTVVSVASYEAAVKAAGAALTAVDRAARGERAIFIAARPPGHHAGPRGAVPCCEHFHRMPEMCSSGFCLFNTVAIAAAYARYRYSAQTKSRIRDESVVFSRVAIVDVDVHYGNGTAAIVENLTPHAVDLPLPASWPRQTDWSYKPWLSEEDPNCVFFGSIHLRTPDGTFYPGGGNQCSRENFVNIPLAPIGPRPGDAVARRALSPAARAALIEKASATFRSHIERDLLPKIKTFAPDLLLISAGFDAHHSDLYYFLNEDDYNWFTASLLTVANPKAVISVLEGGYSVFPDEPPRRAKTRQQTAAAATTEHPLCGLAIAAKAHVQALADFAPRRS